jgi:hypothetical protein
MWNRTTPHFPDKSNSEELGESLFIEKNYTFKIIFLLNNYCIIIKNSNSIIEKKKHSQNDLKRRGRGNKTSRRCLYLYMWSGG